MERRAFKLLHDAESSWWYRARSNVVTRVMAKYSRSRNETILDLGAGYGGMGAILQHYGTVDAFEPDPEARQLLFQRGYRNVLSHTEVNTLPHNTYGLVAIFDVLEHTPDDAAFLTTLFDVLTTDGKIIITVPAFQFLWSEHDVLHHHYRRYSKKSLRTVLEKCGYQVTFMSYWNMLLFFPAALMRKMGKTGESSLTMSNIFDAILFYIVKGESHLIPTLSLPIGTGLVAYAKKIDQDE